MESKLKVLLLVNCSYLVYICVGFVSNGEYNSFRLKGYTRPLSVLQLMSMAKEEVC